MKKDLTVTGLVETVQASGQLHKEKKQQKELQDKHVLSF